MEDAIRQWVREVKIFNKRLHLVSAGMEKGFEDQVRHTVELLRHVREPEIADLGTGSGFPGIPFKIMNPGSKVFLVERSAKKCVFLRHVIDLLDLKLIEVIEADPLQRPTGPFHAVMSRSFSPRRTLPHTVLSMISPQGRFYYFSTGLHEGMAHPRFCLEERLSKDYGTYCLSLDVYAVTSP